MIHPVPPVPQPDRAGRFEVDGQRSTRANRQWWDGEAGAYLAEHGTFLGDAEFVWGPEGWTEDELDVLGPIEGRLVLEFGAGAAQAGRRLSTQGARVVSSDLSGGMLRTGAELNAATGVRVPLVQADATRLPFPDATFDVVFSAFGAVPFIADTGALMKELARVTRRGGLVAFSTTHPIRWTLPDVPDEAGLVVRHSYFDTTPYAEAAGDDVLYAEHHRTLEDRVRELLDAGLTLETLRELPWKTSNEQIWGGWSPLRGRLVPGTLVLSGRKTR